MQCFLFTRLKHFKTVPYIDITMKACRKPEVGDKAVPTTCLPSFRKSWPAGCLECLSHKCNCKAFMKLHQENEQNGAGVFRNKVDKNHDTSLLF